MRLRNKKTGEVENWCIDKDVIRTCDGSIVCNSLAELCEEWEDYKPKEHWTINEFGTPEMAGKFSRENIYDKSRKLIGNDFETKEEAEKAVEKLKAWKRMKDTGCKPITWRWKQDYPNDACYVEVVLKCQFDSGVYDKELELLFGGEE